METRLFASAASPAEYPRDGLPEVAVLGRSNSGKSSFINALCGRRRLARTSGRPGKTRRVHFYRVADAIYLVDLPGYGYAAVARSERGSWRPMVEQYLQPSRKPLRGALLVADVRRGSEAEEQELLAWLAEQGIPARLVLTKCDKVKASRLASLVQRAAGSSGVAEQEVLVVSSTRKSALDLVAAVIREWTGFSLQRPEGGPL